MTQQKQESDGSEPGGSAAAAAHANIALIKYWGKRSMKQNLPAVGSISLTLDSLKTETAVRFDETLPNDVFTLNGQVIEGTSLKRVSNFLDIIFPSQLPRPRAEVVSTNNFPTGAGLASSASGFAALALSASHAAGQELDDKALSQLARQGSGSAARSIYGGFVEMQRGETNSGEDDYAQPIADENYWDIRLIVAATSEEQKSIGSTEGMNRTAETSPFYRTWVKTQSADLDAMRKAIKQKNFERVGELTEYSCFKMHGLAMSARPPLLYWNAVTVKLINTVRELRTNGIPAYVTMDAGPQVKILCQPEYVKKIKQALSTIDGIKQWWVCKPGPAAALISRQKEKA